jgi:hypothetical protein
MADRKLSLIILGKATSALAAMKSVGDEAGDLGKKLTNLLPSFKTVALAGAAAFGAVTAGAYGAVKAAAADQESKRRLAEQIKRTTGATDEQIASVEKLIDKQEIASAVSGDELRVALANLVRTTGDVQFAQEQLNLALDISAATGKDLAGVSEGLGKAFQGNIGALTKLGVPLDQSVIKSKNLSEVIKTLSTQFGGAAAEQADTFSGRLKILEMSLGKVVEGIGYALLPIAERLVAFFQTKVVPVIQAFSDTLAGGGGLRDALLAAGAQMGVFGIKAVNAAETVTKAFVTMTNILIGVAKPIILVLRELTEGFTLLRTGSIDAANKAGQGFTDVYNSLSGLQVSTDDVSVAFENFRNDLLGAAAAATVTQEQLRALDQQARQQASGSTNVVQTFIGPLIAGYGAAGKATKSATELQTDFLTVLKGLQSQAGGTGGKVKEVADKMKAFTDVLVKARDATRSQTEATQAVGKADDAMRAQTDAVTRAQERFNLVIGGFPASARESIDASRRFADAQRSVRDAGLQVADATRGVTEAEKRLADLRAQKADIGKVGAAERALERSKYGVEEANFRVTDAERELAALRADPAASAVAIRRAEINLAEAKLSVSDSVLAIADAERRLFDERNAAATPDEIADAERNLQHAKMEVVDAIDAQTRATEDQSDAQATLNEITMGATIGSKAYDDALKDLTDAKTSLADASEAYERTLVREADAMRDLAEATKILLAAQGATKRGVQTRAEAALGVSVGAGGSVIENIATVSRNTAAGRGGVGATNLTLNVQSGISNPVETANEIIDALRQWERANGSLPLAI